MRPIAFWLLFVPLVLAVIISVFVQLRANHRDHEADRTHRETLQTLREVHAMLVIWAETWPVPEVRDRLKGAVSALRQNGSRS